MLPATIPLNERLGAWLTPQGCFFRVWAPHADAVRVLVQSGPYWSTADATKSCDLAPLDGYWSATVADVIAGNLYRFEITNGSATFHRIDPAAQDVVASELTRSDSSGRNASVVLTSEPFTWTPFDTPRFEDFIIYELHVGSFAGRNDGLEKSWSTFHDLDRKLSYVRDLGFNCLELMPVHEFHLERSWGYNPAAFFAPESSYGSPQQLRHLVEAAHRQGLAVIFDVVYNHAGAADNPLLDFDGYSYEGGIYFEGGRQTDWGLGPAWWKREVQDFFYQNARMFFEDYRADGLRFDVTKQINGNHLRLVVERLRREFPEKYLIAEHLPDDPKIVKEVGFCATWKAESHHECQRAVVGQSPIAKIKSFLGWDGYDHAWNLVKYTLGSHDDIGDLESGDAEQGLTNWDKRHRYFIDQIGGRDNWWARAKTRLAWALNVAMPGTPLLFMGSEYLITSPNVGWGYWHDGSDEHGDHRFDWSIAGDPLGIEMSRLTAAANMVRWQNPALRADSLSIVHEDFDNQVLAFIREVYDNVVLTIVNCSDRDFTSHSYGVRVGAHRGRWTQILCTQDKTYGGWDGAGNAFYEPWTEDEGRIYVNLPKWSVVMFRRR